MPDLVSGGAPRSESVDPRRPGRSATSCGLMRSVSAQVGGVVSRSSTGCVAVTRQHKCGGQVSHVTREATAVTSAKASVGVELPKGTEKGKKYSKSERCYVLLAPKGSGIKRGVESTRYSPNVKRVKSVGVQGIY